MGLLILAAYILLFFATLIAVMWWDRRRRRTRKPFPENLKLLRMPGEFLWRRVVKNDEDEMQWLLVVMLVPMLAGGAVLFVVAKYLRSYPSAGLVATLMVFAFSMLLCVRWCQTRLQRRADDYLGFFGERYVAEWLEPLMAQGWFIFHDIPCAGATGKFNLDHVAVGNERLAGLVEKWLSPSRRWTLLEPGASAKSGPRVERWRIYNNTEL